MKQNTIYEPIRKKVEEWLWYDDNQPKGLIKNTLQNIRYCAIISSKHLSFYSVLREMSSFKNQKNSELQCFKFIYITI